MTIKTGDLLPNETVLIMGENGPQQIALGDKLNDRKVVIFALPGAFSGTCSTAHVPSFIRVMDDLRGKGDDEVICLSVNDPFVMGAWGRTTGATEAGITMMGDPDGTLTKALGMEFSAPQVGLHGRSNRYAILLDDGVITHANVDEPGVC